MKLLVHPPKSSSGNVRSIGHLWNSKPDVAYERTQAFVKNNSVDSYLALE
jgi:hypothetical protein